MLTVDKSTMLVVMHRIIQEVHASDTLKQALDAIVHHVKRALNSDVCSVYLNNPKSQQLTLMASNGFSKETDHSKQACLKVSQKLVETVANQKEPVNLKNPQTHPDYRIFLGEERKCITFVGVPILRRKCLLGVLVIQQYSEHSFDEECISLLVTLAAQLSGSISRAEIIGEMEKLQSEDSPKALKEIHLKGIAGAPGIAMGSAYVLYSKLDLDQIPDSRCKNIDEEVKRFKQAVAQVSQEFKQLKKRMSLYLPSEEQLIFDAYEKIIKSQSLFQKTLNRIHLGLSAQTALRNTAQEQMHLFDKMEDEYLRERGNDIRHIVLHIIKWLNNDKQSKREYPDKTILVGEDISLSQLSEIPPEKLAGIVSARGASASHTAILAKASGIPAVMRITNLPLKKMEAQEIFLNGHQGSVYLQISPKKREKLLQLAINEQTMLKALQAESGEPAISVDGVHIPVYINAGFFLGIYPTLVSKTDGIGLFRTELPFLNHKRFPNEQEQVRIYREILTAFSPCPVTLRSLDIGGDKSLPYFPIEEENPFLGWRGIRVMLDQSDIFRTQLRAMMIASQGLDNLQILIPMLSSLNELDESLEFIQQVWNELQNEGYKITYPRIGAMIEVPSAVYLTEQFAPKVDFISIGSNDLIQYMLAVDRNNSYVSHLYQPLNPAVVWVIKYVIDNAHITKTKVGLCGEMASDPRCALLLLGLGIDNLSVNTGSLATIKALIRRMRFTDVKQMANEILALENPQKTKEILENKLIEIGLGALVYPEKAA